MRKDIYLQYINKYVPFEHEYEKDMEVFHQGVHFLQVNAYRYLRILDFLGSINTTETIIDIGCYPGTLLHVIHDHFPSIILYGIGLGLDESFKNIYPYVKCQEVNIDPDVYFAKYQKTVQNASINPSSVDVVIATEIIEHLYNPYHMIKEAYRLLKPGGYCYATTNNISHLEGFIRLIKGDSNIEASTKYTTLQYEEKSDWRGHVRFYSKRELLEAFKMAGFSDVEIKYFNIITFYKNKKTSIFKTLAQKLLNDSGSYLCNRIEIIARK